MRRHHVCTWGVRAITLIACWMLTTAASATTYHVATTGTDTPGGGTAGAPFRTIGYGLDRLGSGDTLLVHDGLYTAQANFINDGLHAIADGTAQQPTVIRAVNPYRVRIRNAGSTQYFDSPLRVRGQYIDVDGFVFELRDNLSTPLVGEVGGGFNRVTRSIFRRQGTVDQYGGWLYVGGQYQLIEDVGGVGAARYGFATGGPTDDSHHIIFRRVVGRFDFSPSNQPKATFNAYGTDSGWGVHHVLFQNCIAVDGQRAGSAGGEEHYGAWYFPKNMDAAEIHGSIALNNAAAYSGMFVQEQQGRNTVLRHTVSWATTGATGVRWNGTGAITLENLTIGNHAGAAMTNFNSSVGATLRRSFFSGNGALIDGDPNFAEFSASAFLPAGQAYGTGVVTPTGPIRYLPDATNGTGLTNAGAVILQRLGQPGTRYGEPGFDQLTTTPLWPFPYEDELKAVFAEPNTPLSGNTPVTNNTFRGFTVANDVFGKPMTLTRYIWQALGHEIPEHIYGEGFRDGFE